MNLLHTRSRLRFESLLLGIALIAGLLIMPICIYVTGVLMLGPNEGGGFGAFLQSIFVGLGRGSIPVWLMVLGPYALLNLFRATLLLHRRLTNADSVNRGT
jgi:hypothetical protein